MPSDHRESRRMSKIKQRRSVHDLQFEQSVASPPEPERQVTPQVDLSSDNDPYYPYYMTEGGRLTKRYTIAILISLGFIVSFGMRCNISIAKLVMKKEVNNEGQVKFHWSASTEAILDSTFFTGYLISQVPGGILASHFPANKIFGIVIAISSALNFFIPSAMSFEPEAFKAIRLIMGILEGMTYPACHGILQYWAPPLERSTMGSIAFCGSYIAIALGMPLSALINNSFGWQAPFYFYGVCGLIWWCFWLWLVFERPSKHPTISDQELHYLEDSLGRGVDSQSILVISKIPWTNILTSMPVYAIIAANFCRSWNFYMLALFQGRFVHEIFNVSLAKTRIFGATLHMSMMLVVLLGGFLADHMRIREKKTATWVRKFFTCLGFSIEAICFLVIAVAITHRYEFCTIMALLIAMLFSGYSISGFNVNHLDIAPSYASILMGMSNTIGTLALWYVSGFVNEITLNKDTKGWRKVFLTAACVHIFGVIIYGKYCSGKLQRWAVRSNRPRGPNVRSRGLITRPRLLVNRASADVEETQV